MNGLDRNEVDIDRVAIQISVYRFDDGRADVCIDVPWKLLPWSVTVPLLEWLIENKVRLPRKTAPKDSA